MRWRLMLFAATIASSSAFADDESFCRNGFFPSDKQTIMLMRATGAPRTYLLWDSEGVAGCPADLKKCHGGYVLPGQEVLAGKTLGKFTCAFYPNNSGGSAGWVSVDELKAENPQPASDPSPAAWTGKWHDGEDEIDITASGHALHAIGDAVWRGQGDIANVGDFEAGATPSNGKVVFSDSECRVNVSLIGTYLVVADNENCGGMNVRFDGVYTRKR